MVTVTWTTDLWGELEIECSVTRGSPGTRPTLNDPGEPAEGPEIEIRAVYCQGRKMAEKDWPEWTQEDYAEIDRLVLEAIRK